MPFDLLTALPKFLFTDRRSSSPSSASGSAVSSNEHPLVMAAEHGCVKDVKRLLGKHSVFVNQLDTVGRTPLLAAAAEYVEKEPEPRQPKMREKMRRRQEERQRMREDNKREEETTTRRETENERRQ
eukprot:NODE_4673_length_455_cov_80.145320_g4032_i0.p2 GENE.NODE_4673_length_455_cov_80.145320_g4032_i0~~NODE_4673_length_455_cov_80.145320_g4032_i0.p2  ORF type:complete len:127 (+),score=29.36 NODE_4673_length_455_cov_80.145320_g4032_i0:50-430(+)